MFFFCASSSIDVYLKTKLFSVKVFNVYTVVGFVASHENDPY